MKPRATYSKDYKKGQELKKIRETCRCEDRRCLILLKEIIRQKEGYVIELDEYSRLQAILKEFEEQIQGGQKQNDN